MKAALDLAKLDATQAGSLADGAVIGAPRRLLRLEGAALCVGALLAYSAVGRSWWLVPLTLLIPDVTMVGYLGGTRLGSWFYNLGHSTPLPAALVGIGWWQERSLVVALGLIWLAHIGLDRLLGYGLKYSDHSSTRISARLVESARKHMISADCSLTGLRGAGATGLEPATSGVTGRRSNQLNYAPVRAAV